MGGERSAHISEKGIWVDESRSMLTVGLFRRIDSTHITIIRRIEGY